VLPRLAYLTLCRPIQLLVMLARGDAAKDLELMVLRHQLAVVRCQLLRPRLEPADRALLAASAASCPEPAGPASWSSRRRCCAGTAAWSQAPGPTQLVAQDDPARPGHPGADRPPGKEHPRWGYQRVQGELLRLGCGSRHPRSAPPSAVMTGSSARRTATTWRAFLRQQAAGILACDLLHRRHRLAAAAVRAVPASHWTPGGSTSPE